MQIGGKRQKFWLFWFLLEHHNGYLGNLKCRKLSVTLPEDSRIWVLPRRSFRVTHERSFTYLGRMALMAFWGYL